ncbi:MAG: adenylyltransferase/cytidyltransferase family protein, partial [Hyphomicrobiales bacterium]|nr:adenylyltransferase/cytidyltransferase family protein [Hyphomicrobiales bacterium]
MGSFVPDFPDVREGARVGLLGGSFDPAHQGHLAISLRAMRQARLDWVWWMVAEQNPLKDKPSASLRERLAQARRLAGHPLRNIWVSDTETRLGTRYTVDTV